MPSKSKQSAQRVRKEEDRPHLFSAWELDATNFAYDNRWGTPLEASAAGIAGMDANAPTQSTFSQARRWASVNPFVDWVLRMRLEVFNRGLLGKELRPADPKKPDGDLETVWHPGIIAPRKYERKRVADWKKAKAAEIQRITLDVWREYLLMNNVVVAWMPGRPPLLQRMEKVGYKDELGQEKLTIHHGMKPSDVLKTPGLTKEQKEKFASSKSVELTHEDKELVEFRVLKEAPAGCGLGFPALMAVFDACRMWESLEVGDSQLADACRTVYEHHLVGHEIRGGNFAGMNTHFLKKSRADAIEKGIKSRKGHAQLVTNFDHKIIIGNGLPDPKQFDSRRYESPELRLAQWAMPFGQMYLGKTANINLMWLAREAAEQARLVMEPFLLDLYKSALGCPCEIALSWDRTIFWDLRLYLDVLKTGMAAGPVSQTGFLEGVGMDANVERARKLAEADLPAEAKVPAYDPAHGNRPGKDGGKGGRPQATVDPPE